MIAANDIGTTQNKHVQCSRKRTVDNKTKYQQQSGKQQGQNIHHQHSHSTSSSAQTVPISAPRTRGQVVAVDATSTLLRIEDQLSQQTLPPLYEKTTSSLSSSSVIVGPSYPPAISFTAAARDVQTLGSTGLARWDKKEYDRRAAALKGIKSAPNIRTPIKMLVGMKRKNEYRLQKRIQRERDSGLKVKTKPTFAPMSTRRSKGVNDEAAVSLERGDRRNDGLLRVGRQTSRLLLRPTKQVSLAKRMKTA